MVMPYKNVSDKKFHFLEGKLLSVAAICSLKNVGNDKKLSSFNEIALRSLNFILVQNTTMLLARGSSLRPGFLTPELAEMYGIAK